MNYSKYVFVSITVLNIAGVKKDYTLAKSTDGGKTSKDILKKVVSFERKGKFLYASTARKDTVSRITLYT